MFDQIKSSIAHLADHADKHFAAVESITAEQAAPGQSGFCVVYSAARPILVAASGVLFFIPKARVILNALIGGLDVYCTQTPLQAKAPSREFAVVTPMLASESTPVGDAQSGDAPTATVMN